MILIRRTKEVVGCLLMQLTRNEFMPLARSVDFQSCTIPWPGIFQLRISGDRRIINLIISVFCI